MRSGGNPPLFFMGGIHDQSELYQKPVCCRCCPACISSGTKADTIIYIGKAKRLRIRVSQYFREGVPHDNKVSQMIAHAYAFDVIVCQSEFEALVLEASQIKAHTPKYNILLKDDKGYSYIKVTREPGPAFPSRCKRRRTAPSISAPIPPALRPGRWRRPPWMPFCCPGAISASRRRSARGALPERPHRQVHGGVQRQDQLRELQSGRQEALCT